MTVSFLDSGSALVTYSDPYRDDCVSLIVNGQGDELVTALQRRPLATRAKQGRRCQRGWAAALALVAGTAFGQSKGPAQTLGAGEVADQAIRGGEQHVYQVHLAAGRYLDASIDSKGVTVLFSLHTPDGKTFEEELPGGAGAKSIEWIAEEEGEHRLEVLSTAAPTREGRYRLEIRALRVATPTDQKRYAARLAVDEGETLALKSKHELALASYQRGLDLFRELGDRGLEGRTLGKMGTSYRRLRRFQESADALEKSFALRKDLGPYARADALNNLASLARDQLDYQKAIRCYLEALDLMRQAGSRAGEAVAARNLAAVYTDVGSYAEAIQSFTNVLAMMEEEGLVDQQAAVLTSRGRVYWRRGELEAALEDHRRALELWRALKDDRKVAEILVDQGVTHQMLAETTKQAPHYDTAIEELGRALEIHTRLKNDAGRRTVLQGLRRVYASKGEWDKALEYSARALALPGGPDWREQVARARIELQRGRLAEAREEIDRAKSALESARPRLGDDYLRASYEGSVNHLFDVDVDVLMRLHEKSPAEKLDWAAFQASERGRARALLEGLGESRTSEGSVVDPRLVEHERELVQTAAALRSRLGRERGRPEAVAAQAELQKTLTGLEDVRARLLENRRHEALTRVEPPRLEEIQALLDERSLLLEYDLGAEHSYLWAVGKQSWASFTLPPEAEIEKIARRLPERLAARLRARPGDDAKALLKARAAADRAFADEAARLSEMILGPVHPGPAVGRLIFVGDGALHYLPLSALPLPKGWSTLRGAPTGSPVDGSLLGRFELVTLPSVSLIRALDREREARLAPRKQIAVLADPVFGATDERVVHASGTPPPGSRQRAETASPDETARLRDALRLGATMSGLELSRLPYTARLAEVVRKDVAPEKSLAAVGFGANRQAALGRSLADYRTIVFATHGLFDAEFPQLSGIVLSTVDEQGRLQNGILRQHDVQEMSLNADLVVLAGCQTGLGKEIRGEGLMGLSRAFFYAGASRVVASLWNVEERATVELIADFLRRVEKEGKPYATALREAQLAVARDPRFSARYYWAGFVLQGDWR
jgi:CHAT domain-containing protein/tetratricopeptide (TPR) repeat protein